MQIRTYYTWIMFEVRSIGTNIYWDEKLLKKLVACCLHVLAVVYELSASQNRRPASR